MHHPTRPPGGGPVCGWCDVEHEKLPPLCAQLLAELARRDDPTPIAELPERLRQKAVLSGCERRGLAVGVVWYEGSPGSSGVLSGGTPYVAVGTSPGWYPSAGLTHRPPSTHFALTAKGKEWLEEEQLRTGPHGGDFLQDAVAVLLRRVPERWAEYDADALTATESQAMFLLVAAGMVERRIRLRARLHNHPVAVEATITATGEYGFVEAMEPVLATMWAEWKDAYNAWRTGETRGAPLSVTEHLKPDEWRLTDQGALARADLDGGHAERALDFVLRRGFFDGQPRLILEPGRERVSQREPVRSYGQLVTMRKVQADAASSPAVNVGNWKEGADAFAAAFEPVVKAVFEAKAAAEGLVVPDKTPAVPNAPTYTVAALRDLTGLENSALNRYAKTANVTTPRRGERDFKYALADVRAILETIIASTAEDKLRDRCKSALRNLPEIAE